MRVFHVRINGAVKAFAHPENMFQQVILYLRGYRKNWIGPCWGKP